MSKLTIIGAGLAGSEAAWQAASAGIDVDLYEATDIALKLLYDHVVTGGIIILDDYGAFSGANKAVDDFFKNKCEIKKLKYSHAIGYVMKRKK